MDYLNYLNPLRLFSSENNEKEEEYKPLTSEEMERLKQEKIKNDAEAAKDEATIKKLKLAAASAELGLVGYKVLQTAKESKNQNKSIQVKNKSKNKSSSKKQNKTKKSKK